MCEHEIYQNGYAIYQSWISGVPVNKCAAFIDTFCVWNAGVLKVDIHSDCNRLRGDEMADFIKSSKKIISVGYQLKHIMQQRLENGINVSRNMLCKCPFRRYYVSAWGPYV